ncbi:unnamed protein product [Closterium sp. NIES-65]|nr:unnamed protein product [Closterium sp. NIES-65]
MATTSLQCSRLSCQLFSRSTQRASRPADSIKTDSFAHGTKLALTAVQRRASKFAPKASVAVQPTANAETISADDRLRLKETEESSKPYSVIEVDAAEKKEFNVATVVGVQDVAPDVRVVTVNAEISREFIPIDQAYTKPGQTVLVRVAEGEPVATYVSSPPFPSESNWRVLYKLRGDIPAGATKAPQYALSVKHPLELHVTPDHPLYNLQPGAELEVGPFQANGLDLRPIMFLSRFPTLLIFAAGNGIAAARSLIEASDVGSLFLNMRSEVRLFYSAPSPSAVAYKDHFAQWEKLNAKVRPTVDATNGEEWDGLVGSFMDAFDADDLEYDPELTAAVVFGDKQSNQAALQVLKEAGVPEKSILLQMAAAAPKRKRTWDTPLVADSGANPQNGAPSIADGPRKLASAADRKGKAKMRDDFDDEERGGPGGPESEFRRPVLPAAPGDNEEVDMELLEALEREAAAAAAAGEGGAGGGLSIEVMDLRGLRRAVLAFEKRLKENMDARIRHVDQPEKFMESEVELDREVKKLHAVASAPSLYPDLVRLNAVPSILSLLGHENTDISLGAVSLLGELTDADAIGDHEEEAKALVQALVDSSGLELLVQNLQRLDEKDSEEGNAVFTTLGIFENMIEALPSVAEAVCERTRLLRWLLARIRVKEFDANKLYASEILAILLQGSSANQKRVGAMNGVDSLLQAAANYKSRDPKTTEEEEMLENIFDALCSVVMVDENKERFVKSEGVELMIITMKQRKLAYSSAMKALDFATTRCPAACERFVDVLGLKTLFSAFMNKVTVKRKDKSETLQLQQEIDERVISLIASLLSGLSKGSRRDRVLSKFVEGEYEKIDHLLELYMKYWERVRAEERRQEEQQRRREMLRQQGEEEEDEEMTDEDRYLARLEAGLFTLQLIALILAHLWAAEHGGMRHRIDLLLRQQKLSRDHVKTILQEYSENIGDLDGEEERNRRRDRIAKLIADL